MQNLVLLLSFGFLVVLFVDETLDLDTLPYESDWSSAELMGKGEFDW
jgi:hypothetical protein